jgi:hypothetical protein
MKPMAVERQVQPTKEVEMVPNADDFARILAEVVNDPSIARVLVEKKPAEPPVKITDETVKVPIAQNGIKVVPAGIKTNEAVTGSTKIEKLAKDSTSEGLLMSYRDIPNNDTVKIFMPVSKNETVKPSPDTVAKKTDVVKKDARFIDMELQNPNLKTDSGTIKKDDVVITEKATDTATGSNAGKLMLNPDCKKSATQNDFLKLRKTMAAEANEKDMTKTAIKQFITTCYTTEQVKYLGALFITEEEKYKFFVAAFPHVWDIGNYKEVEDQLKDEYYKTRFKAMFNH